MWSVLDRLLYDQTTEEEQYRKIRQKSSSLSAIVVGMVAAMGGFLYGYDTGLINDILEMQYVSTHFPSNGYAFNTHERALVTAMLSLGTFVGAVLAPLLSDTYGRKFSIVVLLGLLCNAGNIIQVAALDIAMLCVGRVMCGIAVGILSASVPLYQAEASPKWVRGSIVFTYQWAITWGLMIALAVCQGTRKFNNSGSYRLPIALQFLWASILCLGMLFLPESPRFYVQKNKIQKGLESLSKLRRLPMDDADLIEELVEIKANYDYEMLFGKTSLIDCFRNGGGRHKQVLRMATGIGIHALQQCLGINFIFYYGVNFFSSTGMKNYYLMSFITYTVNTLFTIPGIILIEVIGRRSLMLWGGTGMSVSNFIIAIMGVCISDRHTSSILSVSFSCVFIAFFAASWGGCTWALVSDIYGISIRQKAISITVATNWLVNFICAYITPYLIDTGAHTAALKNKIFFIWGGFNALGVVFVYFMVYETKGLKLEEIDYMYVNCSNARASTKFKSQNVHWNTLLLNEFLENERAASDPKLLHEPASASSSEKNKTHEVLGGEKTGEQEHTHGGSIWGSGSRSGSGSDSDANFGPGAENNNAREGYNGVVVPNQNGDQHSTQNHQNSIPGSALGTGSANPHDQTGMLYSSGSQSSQPDLTDYQRFLWSLGHTDEKLAETMRPPSVMPLQPECNPVIARQFFEAPPSESDSDSDGHSPAENDDSGSTNTTYSS